MFRGLIVTTAPITALTAVGIPRPAAATVIENTFGPGNSFDERFATGVFSLQSVAMPIRVTSTGTISEVVGAFTSFVGFPSNRNSSLALSIQTEISGVPSGVTLWSTLVPTPPFPQYNLADYTGLAVPVVGGSEYWLVAESPEDNGWGLAFGDAHGVIAFEDPSGGGWTRITDVQDAYRVVETISPIEEPTSLALLGLGLLVFGITWYMRSPNDFFKTAR